MFGRLLVLFVHTVHGCTIHMFALKLLKTSYLYRWLFKNLLYFENEHFASWQSSMQSSEEANEKGEQNVEESESHFGGANRNEVSLRKILKSIQTNGFRFLFAYCHFGARILCVKSVRDTQ